MTTPEQNSARTAGFVLAGWLVLHQFLIGDPGQVSHIAIFLLVAGFALRMVGVFPPVAAGWILFAGTVVFSGFVARSTAAVVGALSGLLGAVLLLQPLSSRRGLWILLCAVTVLASICLQDSGTFNAVFVVLDVAVLMFLAQQIHVPPEAGAAVWASALRSLRLIVPVALVVSVVFWLFPEISSRTNVAFVSFLGGDLVSPGEASEIRLTRRVAFVATFPEPSAVPSFSDLYWRGQVLENNDGLRWSVDPARINSHPERSGSLPEAGAWKYFQHLGPDRTLAALDRPVSIVARNHGATILETGASVYSVLGTGDVELEILSASSPAGDPPRAEIASGSLLVPEKIRNDPGLRKLASTLLPSGTVFANNLESVGRYFATRNFAYTLRPGKIQPGDVAWFLFQHRKGFCGHYAASAACLLRMGGIPARIVTGFRGGTWNPWLRTLTLRDSDAHAWVEAWDENARSWTRFDPTSYVAPELSTMLELERNPDRWPWFRLATTYAATVVARGADRLGAMLSHHPLSIWWTVVLAVFGVAVAIRLISVRRKSKSDIAASGLAKLEKIAASKNRRRLLGETPLAWLARLETLSQSGPEAIELRRFSEIYESLVYAAAGPVPQNIAALDSCSKRLALIWRIMR